MFASCEQKEIEAFGNDAWLQFSGDTLQAKSFIYDPPSVLKDTVHLYVQIVGRNVKKDRQIKIEQVIDTGNVNVAVAGEHFLAFTDPEFSKHLMIKADSGSVKLPIVLYRHDILKKKSFTLKVRLLESGDFKLGESTNLVRTIVFSDKLEKPSYWDRWGGYLAKWYLGAYGPVKHRFMIDVTGLKIDDKFLEGFVRNATLRNFYMTLFKDKLREYNDAHPDNPLREEPKEGQTIGDLVQFV